MLGHKGQHFYSIFHFFVEEINDLPYILRLRCLRHGHLCGFQHVFDKDAVARGGIVDHNVSRRSVEFVRIKCGTQKKFPPLEPDSKGFSCEKCRELMSCSASPTTEGYAALG